MKTSVHFIPQRLKFSLGIAILSILYLCGCNLRGSFNDKIEADYGKLGIELIAIENGKIKKSLAVPFSDLNTEISFADARWQLEQATVPIPGKKNTYKVNITARVIEGEAVNVSVGLKLSAAAWTRENYVLMPGAAYNGNRYRSIIKVRGVSTDMALAANPGEGPLMSNVPRLNYNREASLLQQLSGDMATPALAYRSAKNNKGIVFLTEQGTPAGDYSFTIRENKQQDEAEIIIRMPGFRQDSVFKGGGQRFMPTPDRGADLKQGESLELQCNIYLFDAPAIQSLFDYFVVIRKDMGNDFIPHEIPYYAAWEIMEEKYNKQNWVEKHGYYSVGMRESMYQDWQTGWVGGMNTVYPLLVMGSDSTFVRAIRTFDFLFDSISPSGLFYEVFYDGTWRLKDGSSFLRRNSDALYFINKSFLWLQSKDNEFEIPEHWLTATQKCADAFVKLWKEYGEFGQLANFNSGKLTASGTSSNGIAPGALALTSRLLGQQHYMDVAKESADFYYYNFVVKGITNGGPGDIYQGIDSESAFGLLESFVVLYEVTGEAKWLQYAEEMAKQSATWVTSYNFRFPEGSTFARLNMHTTGTVIANIQNKHSSPGICTLSGSSLLKLYRYTGNRFYLELLRDISKTLPQYMSRSDRPIPDPRPGAPWPVMPPGWINERVNLSDWEERGTPGDIKRGEIFGGSTWSEAAFMNTHAEVPGIYILKDKKEITILDNIEAEYTAPGIITLHNPTPFDATIRIMIETTDMQKTILSEDYMKDFWIMDIASGERKNIPL
jgi:hypothetical protein